MPKDIILKSFTVKSEDGVFVRIEETEERKSVVLSLSREGKIECASLNEEQFDGLFDLKYSFQFYKPEGKNEKPD